MEELEEVLDLLFDSEAPQTDKSVYPTVFRRLLQEHIADQIYLLVRHKRNKGIAKKEGLNMAEVWFGKDESNWPIEVNWLREYIEKRWVNDSIDTEEKVRIEDSQDSCDWVLGCSVNNPVYFHEDHKRPKSHGGRNISNSQILCRFHNRRWKGDLLFWDNEISFVNDRS